MFCQNMGKVYVSKYMICEKSPLENGWQPHEGKYISQTSQNLYERSLEHVKSLKRYEFPSFMLKHWAMKCSKIQWED